MLARKVRGDAAMARDYIQLCYVTNDFERAIEQLRGTHSIGPFKEMRDLRVPTTPNKAVVGHFGLAFKAETQFEVIQPVAEDVAMYRDVLSGQGFQMRFHHIGRHIASLSAYRANLTQAKARWPVPIDVSEFGGNYAYADARSEYGHYLEWFCFPDDDAMAHTAPRYD
jgi:hypothetical protein